MLFIFIEDFSILFNNNTDFHFDILIHTKESLSGERGSESEGKKMEQREKSKEADVVFTSLLLKLTI